jgi:hypothetical protein
MRKFSCIGRFFVHRQVQLLPTSTMNPTRFVFVVGIIIAAALSRILPHPPNFAPMNAIALFAGAYLSERKGIAIIVPLLAMWISDAALQVLTGWGFHTDMWVIYGTIALITALSFPLAKHRNTGRIGAFTLVAAIVFFVLSNLIPFALHGMYGMYPRTLDGLVACFVAALPFFQHSLMGDVVYTTILFGGFALAERTIPALRPQQA